MGCVPRRHMPTRGPSRGNRRGQALDQCVAAQFLSDELLLEIPSDERAHCSQKHKGGNSHPNGGFESVIHVHREPPKNAAATETVCGAIPGRPCTLERNAPKKP